MPKQKTDEQFDDFFRDHLLGSELDPSDEVWKKLAPAVKKNNFFTFGFRHFNFYYIVAATVLAALLFLFLFSENESTIPDSSPIENNTPDILPKEQSIPSSGTPAIEKPLSEIKREKRKQKSSVKPSEVISSDTSAARQTPFVSVPDPVVEEKKPEVKSPTIKKIVTVIEQDTLIREDTVNVHRKRKRK